jgi:hypothetical protein
MVYRSAVAVSLLLTAAAALAALHWDVHSQCNELPTPNGVGFALLASVVALGVAFVAMMLAPRGVRVAWQVVAGFAVIAGGAALLLASYAGPAGGCG